MAAARARPLFLALAASALLLVYGNAASSVPPETREWVFFCTNLIVMALAIVAASAAAMKLDELGLSLENARSSAVFGLAVGLAVALPPVVFVVVAPLISGTTVKAGDLNALSSAGLAERLMVRALLGTALTEEVLFRGVLFALWYRAGALRGAVLGSSLSFAFWHLVIAYGSIADADVVRQQGLVIAGYAASLIGVFVGGIIFALLRWRTTSVAGPFVAHWVILATMQTAIWARG